MAGIELRGVSRVFPGGGTGIDGLDLEVREGELLVLVGPSGSGKTTTLRVVAGLEEGTSGSVWIGGREVTKLPPRERNVAMVFQGLGLYEHLSVQENLGFGLRSRGQGSGVRSQVEEIAVQLGIEKLLARKPGELSGGEQQRVALGRALVRQPAALLLDEPLSSLDPPLRSELRRLLKELQRRLKVTTVYVTHDQGEAMSLGERIAVIRDGRVEQVGTPKEVYFEPKNIFVAGFIGEGMNLLEGELVKSEEGTVFVSHGRQIRVFGSAPDNYLGKAVMGVRPGNLALYPFMLDTTPQDVILPAVVTNTEWCATYGLVEARLELESDTNEAPLWRLCYSFVGRGGFPAAYEVGKKVKFHLDEGKRHWFDAAGNRLEIEKNDNSTT